MVWVFFRDHPDVGNLVRWWRSLRYGENVIDGIGGALDVGGPGKPDCVESFHVSGDRDIGDGSVVDVEGDPSSTFARDTVHPQPVGQSYRFHQRRRGHTQQLQNVTLCAPRTDTFAAHLPDADKPIPGDHCQIAPVTAPAPHPEPADMVGHERDRRLETYPIDSLG